MGIRNPWTQPQAINRWSETSSCISQETPQRTHHPLAKSTIFNEPTHQVAFHKKHRREHTILSQNQQSLTNPHSDMSTIPKCSKWYQAQHLPVTRCPLGSYRWSSEEKNSTIGQLRWKINQQEPSKSRQTSMMIPGGCREMKEASENQVSYESHGLAETQIALHLNPQDWCESPDWCESLDWCELPDLHRLSERADWCSWRPCPGLAHLPGIKTHRVIVGTRIR